MKTEYLCPASDCPPNPQCDEACQFQCFGHEVAAGRMHHSAVQYALRRQINLGRFHGGRLDGYYFLREDGREYVSLYPTAKSAINLMKKHK